MNNTAKNNWNSFDHFAFSFASGVIRDRYYVFILSLIFTLVFALGIRELQFTADYRVFFNQDNPDLMAFEDTQKEYTKSDNIIFAIKNNQTSIFEESFYKLVKDLDSSAKNIPHAESVESLANYRPQLKSLEDKKESALKDNLIVNSLLSEDGTTTGINIPLHINRGDQKALFEAANKALEIKQDFVDKNPDTPIALSGIVMFNKAFVEASITDLSTLVPMMYLIITLIMIILLRSINATIAILVVVALSTIATMGITGFTSIALSPPSTISPIIVLTLAVANSIHIIVTLFKEVCSGKSKEEAIKESIRINLFPVFLTSLTSVIGFVCLNFSEVPAFRDLGNVTAIGITMAFLYSVILLPCMLQILPIRVCTKSTESKSAAMDKIACILIEHKRKLLAIMLAIVAILIFYIPKIILNDEFVKYFDESMSFRQDTDFISKNLTGIYQMAFSLPTKQDEKISDPEYLQAVDKLTNWLETQSEVYFVSSFSKIIKSSGTNVKLDQTPIVEQIIGNYKKQNAEGKKDAYIKSDDKATRINIVLRDLSSSEIMDVKKRFEQWIKNNLPDYMQANAVGTSVMFASIAQRNIKAMILGTTISLILISFVLIFALKNFKIGLISLIPNLIPPIMAFGIWSILVGRVGMDVSIVTAMCLGIIVDDTIHFLSKYLRAIKEKQLDSEEAVKYSFSTVGVAIFTTSLVIIAGFCVLSLSSFVPNSRMGLLNAIMILMALVTVFFLLPPLLMLCQKKKPKS